MCLGGKSLIVVVLTLAVKFAFFFLNVSIQKVVKGKIMTKELKIIFQNDAKMYF